MPQQQTPIYRNYVLQDGGHHVRRFECQEPIWVEIPKQKCHPETLLKCQMDTKHDNTQ